jgi:hypothetical protein
MLAASSNFVYPVNPVVDIWKVTHPVEWLDWNDARADFDKAEARMHPKPRPVSNYSPSTYRYNKKNAFILTEDDIIVLLAWNKMGLLTPDGKEILKDIGGKYD